MNAEPESQLFNRRFPISFPTTSICQSDASCLAPSCWIWGGKSLWIYCREADEKFMKNSSAFCKMMRVVTEPVLILNALHLISTFPFNTNSRCPPETTNYLFRAFRFALLNDWKALKWSSFSFYLVSIINIET